MNDDATRAQVLAADPDFSTWLAANAGSGKTRVLTDRVARLLMAGTAPQRILCLTYTKAAASEMQNRLFRRLGRWAMRAEDKLRDELAELGVEGAITPEVLSSARRLFARAIETPGGLKIQTIHAFCAGLLRRFPLEARVSPDFHELDERSALLLRQEVVEEMADGDDPVAVAALAGLHPGEDMAAVLGEICRNSDAFSAPVADADLSRCFDLAPGFDEQALLSGVFLGGEDALIAGLLPLLATSGPKDQGAGRTLANVRPTLAGLALLEDVLLYSAAAKCAFAAKLGAFPTKALAGGAAAPFVPALEALMLRVEAARPLRLALGARTKTRALHRFAGAFLPRYQARKAMGGLLDFDDLIGKAAALLSDRSVAAWVLYRLDGGIDHILVDEAQDTSPGQWRVIERLAEEFTAGEGARGAGRRIFVVGDKKQSIYSFQGADLVTFDAMRAEFEQRHRGARAPFQALDLRHSFRSSRAILDVVDKTFGDEVNRGLGGPTQHQAFRADMPGRVDLWPAVPKTPEPAAEPWDNPVDQLADSHETVLLARQIAAEIAGMIARGTVIKTRDGQRALHEGDVLILVRRRRALFQEIIRACKAAGLRVAGADRLKLADELAVKDILALLSFLALPEDDLSLAAVLRSPLFGWSEAALYDLAHGRGPKAYLWQALRAEEGRFSATMAVLDDLRGQADFLRPYELIDRLLTRFDGRRKLLARLGTEAEEAIDALLAEALAYEQASVPSLTGFLVWMQSGDVEVKRQTDSAARAIRVMTVHGAKGLEAPVVILPDAAKWAERDRGAIARTGDGVALWRVTADQSPPVLTAAAERRRAAAREERMRLLYVAMTRAESWLIVCAAGDVGSGDESWHSLVAAGLERAGAIDVISPTHRATPGLIRRHQYGQWPDPLAAVAEAAGAWPDLPAWATGAPVAAATPDKPLSPSDLGGAKALPGEAGLDEAAARRQGTWLHLMLQHLPGLPRRDWPEVAARLAEGVDSAETDTVFAEARAVIDAPDLGPLFQPGALVEVELAAHVPELGGRMVQGTVDRLVILPDRILAVDFKSNRQVPDRPEDVPEGILRQLGAYAAMLGQIYPDRKVDVAVVWTRTAQLMVIPPNIVRAAMQKATLP